MHSSRIGVGSLSGALVGMLLVLAALGPSRCAAQSVPAQAANVWIQDLGFSKKDLAKVDRGEVRTTQADNRDEREIGLFGLVRLTGSGDAFVGLFRDLTQLAVTEDVSNIQRLSCPPRIEDFAELPVESEDVLGLRTCRSGDCLVKLSAAMIDTLRDRVPWSAPDAPDQALRMYRSLLADYAARYAARGAPALITYADRPSRQSLSGNLRELLDRTPSLLRDLPEVYARLLDQPALESDETVEESESPESFLYWARRKFGPKWVITMTRATIFGADAEAPYPIVTLKQVYANHFFQGALQVYRLFAIPDAGVANSFYLVVESRTLIDPARGPLAGIQRSKIRGQAQSALEARLTVIRDALQASR